MNRPEHSMFSALDSSLPGALGSTNEYSGLAANNRLAILASQNPGMHVPLAWINWEVRNEV